MKMAELERRTGVNRETIRVLVRRGLLAEPERPKPTVAHYTEEHVSAVIAIRQLQQQYRMTLAQISRFLHGKPVDQRVEATAFPHLEQLLKARFDVEEEQTVSVDSLTALNEHATGDAEAFETIGLLERIASPTGYMLSHTDARLVTIWGEMRQAGFDEANFPPDSLDHYMRAAEDLAKAEAERFLARTEGRMSEDQAADMLRFALPLMLDFFGLVRTKFFIRNIARANAERASSAITHND